MQEAAAAISTDHYDYPQYELPTLVTDAALPTPDVSEQHHVNADMKDHLSLPLRTPDDPASSSLPLSHGDMHSATSSSSSSSSRESNSGSRQPPTVALPPLPPRGISTSSALGPSSAPRTWRAFLQNHRRFVFLLFLVTALLVGGTFAMARYKDQLLQGAQYIQDRAPLSAVYTALLLILWIVLCLPATLLEVVAGMIYTWPVAVISITVGKQLGCNLGFWLGQCITTGSFKEAFLGRLTQREQEARGAGIVEGEMGVVEGEVVGGEEVAHVEGEEEEPTDLENSRTALQPVSSRSSSSSNGSSSSSSTPTHSAPNFPSTSITTSTPAAAEPIADVLPPTSVPSSLPPSSSDLPPPLPPPTTTTTPPPPRRRRPKATPTEALMWAVKMHPWQICFLLRLLPVPIAVKNYGMSCLPFPVLIYTLCCFVAELPFTILWVHIGQSCRSLLEAMEGHQKGKTHLMQEILVLVLSVVLLVALGVLMRRYTAKYARYLEEEREKEEAEEVEREAQAATAAAEVERRRVASAAGVGEAAVAAPVRGGEGQ